MSLVVRKAVNTKVDESKKPESVGLELWDAQRSGNNFMKILLFIVNMFIDF